MYFGYFKSITIAATLFAGAASTQLTAQEGRSLPAPFGYPPVGSLFETSNDQFLIERTDGFDAIIRNLRTNATFGMHAGFISGSAVNTNLRYDREKVESLWPLEIGKSITYDSNRDLQVWTTTAKVLRTETIKLPAGAFFTYVVEFDQRGIGNNTYRGTKTFWYAPEIRFFARYQEVVHSQNSQRTWELVTSKLSAAPPPPQPSAVPSTTSPSDEVAARLQRLQSLLQKNLITPEEYNNRRKAILDQL